MLSHPNAGLGFLNLTGVFLRSRLCRSALCGGFILQLDPVEDGKQALALCIFKASSDDRGLIAFFLGLGFFWSEIEPADQNRPADPVCIALGGNALSFDLLRIVARAID